MKNVAYAISFLDIITYLLWIDIGALNLSLLVLKKTFKNAHCNDKDLLHPIQNNWPKNLNHTLFPQIIMKYFFYTW